MNTQELVKWLMAPSSEVRKEIQRAFRKHKCARTHPYTLLVEGRIGFQQTFRRGKTPKFWPPEGRPDFPIEMLDDKDNKGVLKISCGDCGAELWGEDFEV